MHNTFMRTLFGLSVCAAISLAVVATGAAQSGERRVMTFQQGEVFFFNEFGVLVTSGDAGLTVDMCPPPKNRVKAYQDVDLQEKDIILMFNGKRVKSIADLQDRYDSLKAGEEVKLGIKRGEEMRLVAFPKLDQSTMPQTRQIMLGGDADAATAQAGGAPQQGMIMNWSGGAGEGEIVAVPEMGLVFTAKDTAVQVASILPNAQGLFKEYAPQEGDIVKAIGGTNVRDLDAFQGLYDKIPVGGDVQLIFVRDKKETTVSVKKAEAPPQNMIIKK